MKQTKKKINKTKGWFFGKMHKIDNSLAGFIKKKRGLKIKNEREVKIDTTEVQILMRDYCDKLRANSWTKQQKWMKHTHFQDCIRKKQKI